MKARSILLLAAMSGSAAMAEVGHPERYVQSRSGEIQILPALTLEEIPRGKVSGVESAGGFVFDIDDAMIDKSVARKLELIRLQFIEKNRRIV